MQKAESRNVGAHGGGAKCSHAVCLRMEIRNREKEESGTLKDDNYYKMYQ